MPELVDTLPLLLTIFVTLLYRVVGKTASSDTPLEETKETPLMKTLDIIDDRLSLHEDLVNIIKELEEIRKVLNSILEKGTVNGS